MNEKMKAVIIYTDGAAEPNPGPGGYAAILVHGQHRKELSGGFQWTTNNRMEVMAAIAGLTALTAPCAVTLYSDSRYLVNAMTRGLARRWRANGWKRNKRDKAVNTDLWEQMLTLCEKHQVSFKWVKGHAGHRENERCDELCVAAASTADLPVDEGYGPMPAAAHKVTLRKQKTGPKSKVAVTEVGQPCRECGTPVIKKITKRKPRKARQEYYFEYYLYCPGCRIMYMVEDAKRFYP